MCYCAHRSIDAALDVKPRVALDRIAGIEVTLGKIQAKTLKNHQPRNGLDAIFSVEFGVAAALIAGNVGLREVSDEFVARDDVQKLLAKVTVNAHEDYDPAWPSMARFDQVHVRLADGNTISSEPVHRALGDSTRPLASQDLRAKFIDCFAAGGSTVDAAQLLDRLQRIETVASIRDLYRIAPAAVAA